MATASKTTTRAASSPKPAAKAPSVKKQTGKATSKISPSSSAKPAPKVPKFDIPSLQDLLEAGAHFGHKVSRWNPKMEPYIFDTRNNMHIIDLTKTLGLLENAVKFLYESAQNGNILLVGTKGQAATIIKNAGIDHGAYYISRRWPGGLLTNFKVVRKSVLKMMEMEENLSAGKGYETKRERLVMERARDRLIMLYEGIRFMDKPPAAILVIDSRVEKNAMKEARKKGIPVVALLDTNCDPTLVDYPIPANDDAIRSIELFVSTLIQGFSNTNTSADLIQKRNDYNTRLEQTRKQTEVEEERIRRERELEVQRLKAMKEGKELPQMPGEEGKLVRIVQKEVSTRSRGRITAPAKSAKPAANKTVKSKTPTASTKKSTKTAAKKITSKKTATKKTATRKKTTRKTTTKKSTAATKKTVAKKTTAKKSAAQKTAKKTASKK